MTTHPVPALFTDLRGPDRGIVWLADELTQLAQHAERFLLELRWINPPAGTWAFACELSGHPSVELDRKWLRLFRPLLARMARMAADESGTEFDPYHGSYTLRRASTVGPVALHIAITNTPGRNRLEFVRQPLVSPVQPRAETGGQVAAPPTPAP